MSRKLVREMWDQIGHKKPVLASQDDTIYEAARIMDRNDVGALIIVDGQSLVGVLSERDIVRKVDAKGLDRFETVVGDVMTGTVVSVDTGATHDECNELMSEKAVRHLPVLDDLDIVGMVSMLDLIKSNEYDARIDREHLEGYLKGV